MENQSRNELTHSESMKIIQQMIGSARNTISDNGSGWLLWGSMIFLASITTFFLMLYKVQPTFLAWNIFGGIAVILLALQLFRPKRKTVRTYAGDVLKFVDYGFVACLFIIILSINILGNPNSGFGYLLMLYGFLMLVQGGALKFNPLIIGAIINWAGAIAIFINKDFKYDMLITAIAVFAGYIIPGILLRKANQGKHGV